MNKLRCFLLETIQAYPFLIRSFERVFFRFVLSLWRSRFRANIGHNYRSWFAALFSLNHMLQADNRNEKSSAWKWTSRRRSKVVARRCPNIAVIESDIFDAKDGYLKWLSGAIRVQRTRPKLVGFVGQLGDIRDIRDLKQARRTATAVNKQLNFRVKKKPQITDYVYVLHIWSIFYD